MTKKKIIERPAPAGKVTTQETTIFLMTPIFNAAIPLAIPTPSTAPTRVWVVEIGKPVPDANTTVEAAANSAAKPLLGVRCVIPSPIVLITRCPNKARPATIPNPPSGNIHQANGADLAISPPLDTILTRTCYPRAQYQKFQNHYKLFLN